MTSRTNGHAEGQNRAADSDAVLCDLETRRQEAVKRYLDGEPIEQICQAMRCSKSWLYKWKNRYQVTEPDWSQPRTRRPATFSSKTPETVEAENHPAPSDLINTGDRDRQCAADSRLSPSTR